MNPLRRLREDEGFRTIAFAIASALALAASFFKWTPGLSFDIAWVAIALCGAPIVYGAAKGMATDFDVTADLLVAIALVAAIVIGEYFAAGEVAFIMQLGKLLEDLTAERSHRGLAALVKLSPQRARLRTEDGEREVPASELKSGDVVVVRPGQAVPVDGLVLSGSSSVDQSAMTGESLPVDKSEGDAVFQGTINQEGALEIRATSPGSDSSLQKMIRLALGAERKKAPMVRIADKWARILVPVALACAAAVWLVTGNAYRAVTALVVFCPCSLVLATPTAVMAVIGNATRKGILIKSGAAVEALSKIDCLVADKTGTLTCGELRVEELALLDTSIGRDELISMAASAELYSEHPIGKAIVERARADGLEIREPESFEARPGRGVVAGVGGRAVAVGERAIGRDILAASAEAQLLGAGMEERGMTVVPVAIDGGLAGLFAVADGLRAGAASAVAALRRGGLSRIVMLTGDRPAVAEAIGRAAGVGELRASLLPEDKVAAIAALRAEGLGVAMLGDGVNDAPALASASVGIVMGAIGSDAAIEAADVALMGDELGKLPFLFELCRSGRRRIAFNIALSMCLNFGAIILAGFGMLDPVTAALVHNGGSVFVVVNSALLLAYREKPSRGGKAAQGRGR